MVIRPCCDCGDLTTVRTRDELAMCEPCKADRRELELRVREVHAQAGAQFVGRERGTRDDRDARRRPR